MSEILEKENEGPNSVKVNPKGDWSWNEPTNEEFEKLRKNFTFYRIYTVENGKSKNLFKFWHVSDSDALRVLNLFKESHPEYGDNCFYSTSGYFIDPDGSRHDTLFENDENKCKKRKIKFSFSDFWFRVKDFWFRVKDTFYFFRHGHSMKESWSIDSHLLEDLRFNLKKLAENTNGCPTFICERAKFELNKTDKEEWNYDNDEMELAMKMWIDELNKLRENVLLYEYYDGYGIVEEDDKEMVEIDRKYRDTLPYKPGTKNEFDFPKLRELAKERWDNIWNWIKEYGESLWD